MGDNKCVICRKVIPEGRWICPQCDPERSINKYGNNKLTVDGIVFDSRKEYRRYCELKLLLKAGRIKDLQRQVKFVLIPSQKIDGRVAERECAYYADFAYIDTDSGRMVVEDVKSPATRTKDYIIKRKLMLWIHKIRIEEV